MNNPSQQHLNEHFCQGILFKPLCLIVIQAKVDLIGAVIMEIIPCRLFQGTGKKEAVARKCVLGIRMDQFLDFFWYGWRLKLEKPKVSGWNLVTN